MEHHELHVDGMSCTACEAAIKSEIGSLGSVSRVEADREASTVAFVAADVSAVHDVGRIVENLGYEIVADPRAEEARSTAGGD